MDQKQIADMFKALGDPTRLRIFELLQCCACAVSVGEEGEVSPTEGPTAGEICCQITGADKITSTISFHLKELRNAGLINMEKRGKSTICSLDQAAVSELMAYLGREPEQTGDCC